MYSDYDKYSLSLPSDPDLSTGQFSFAPSTGVPVTSKFTASGDFSNPSGDQFDDNPPPPPPPVKPKPLGPWSTGLCGCFEDVRTCCITCWCPCITFGRISEIVDKGASSCGMNGALYAIIICVTGCPCLFSCFYRSKMRQQQRLKEKPCGDCCVHCCCEGCALCQEYRELESRGYDMKIGWHGNIERRTRGVEMEPIELEEMSR